VTGVGGNNIASIRSPFVGEERMSCSLSDFPDGRHKFGLWFTVLRVRYSEGLNPKPNPTNPGPTDPNPKPNHTDPNANVGIVGQYPHLPRSCLWIKVATG